MSPVPILTIAITMMSIPKTPNPEAAPDLSIRGDQVAIHPPGYVAPQDEAQEQNLTAHVARFRASPLDFLKEVSLHVSGTGWRSYDDIIGQPIFYPGFSEKMKASVMRAPLLQEKIEALAEARTVKEEEEGLLAGNGDLRRKRMKRKQELKQSLIYVTVKMTDDMICKMESKRFIRGAYYMCTQLLTKAYHQGIHVSSEEVLRLRTVANEAMKKRQSIIFLPCHRSHVDYVSLQLICYRLGIGLPTVVAGDNLNFPLVGPFLQHAGAMYIRRRFGHDALYTTLVQSYVDTLLQQGLNFECFIEGGRSRTGKLLPPKFGILGFLVDSVLSGRVDDAILCPVSTQYDKVLETESYISELLGQPKSKENLGDFLSASSILSLRLGRVDVRFHEPYSLKDFIAQQRRRIDPSPSEPALLDPQSMESRIRLLRTLGYRVLSDINEVSVVMPTALVGTVLLTLRGRGVGQSELVRRVDWLSSRVRARSGRVAHFANTPTVEVVQKALEVLGPELVGVIRDLPEVTYYAVDRFQLSFYRNMTIHLFISESLVCAAMYTRVKQGGGPANQRISFDNLFAQVSFLSQVFRGEFIYPTTGLKANLERTLMSFEEDDVVIIERDHDGGIRSVDLSPHERTRGRENFDFYCFLIWPFIESTWLAAVSLMALSPPSELYQDTWVDLKLAQDKAQLLGKTLYHQGDLSYFESVNKENLKNAYLLFEEEGMCLVHKSKDPKVPTTTRLAPDWTPPRDKDTGKIIPSGRIWDFTETVAQSRREGKNRRDGATVSTRVLSLADTIGRQLFETAASDDATQKGQVKVPAKRKRRGIQTRARL